MSSKSVHSIKKLTCGLLRACVTVYVCYAGGIYLSKLIQSKARLFTRNIKEPGASFEYVLFDNSEEQKCVGILQAGHLLEGPPG